MPLGPHLDAFTRFADSYLTGGDKDEFIILKREHSLRVLDNAIAIAENERLDHETARLCHLSALYHDIGRFPQFAAHGTFNDRESVNHGRMGVLALRETGLPEGLDDRDRRTVRFAVGQHNLKTIRPALPSHLTHPVHIVRDADKLDIMHVMIDHFQSDSPDPVITLGLDPNAGDEYSDTVYRSVLEQQIGDYTLLRYANDFLLLLLSWVYSFHYRTTLDLVRRRNYLEHIFSLLPKDDKIQLLEKKLLALVHYKDSVAS